MKGPTLVYLPGPDSDPDCPIRAGFAPQRYSRNPGLGALRPTEANTVGPTTLILSRCPMKVEEERCKATWKRIFKLPWREAGPPNRHDGKVDSGQYVVNEELSLCTGARSAIWGKALNLRTTTLQKCAVVPRRARI